MKLTVLTRLWQFMELRRCKIPMHSFHTTYHGNVTVLYDDCACAMITGTRLCLLSDNVP